MQQLILIMCVLVLGLTRPSEACIQRPEANELIGWSSDGTRALHAHVDKDGNITHAEIHPTRYEGTYEVIFEDEGDIVVIRFPVGECGSLIDSVGKIESARGPLTRDALMKLGVVQAMKLVTPPADDGGASKMTAKFTPAKKRYGEKTLEVKAGSTVTKLTVPVWCVGSCFRDEEWYRFGATVTKVAKAGDRTLYVVRMRRVCNGANGKDMWMDRVVAVPGSEPKPKFSRCRGSGE